MIGGVGGMTLPRPYDPRPGERDDRTPDPERYRPEEGLEERINEEVEEGIREEESAIGEQEEERIDEAAEEEGSSALAELSTTDRDLLTQFVSEMDGDARLLLRTLGTWIKHRASWNTPTTDMAH